MGATTGSDTAALHLHLQELEKREREISRQRRMLHDRIDSFPNEALIAREKQVSAERKALHREIDELRVQLGLPLEH
jgi:chromosome segregation ATPase